MIEIYCSDCEIEFERRMWESGECPKCGREYWWEDYWDGEEEYSYIEWEPAAK
jgi:hypothetical protein